MPFAPVRDLQLYYELHGPETAEPLLLLNGAFGVIGPKSDWSYQLPHFAQKYHVIAFEHRGHGRTGNPAGRFSSYEELVEDAVALLNYLKIEKAHMVGFSDGAITLLYLAQRYPDLIADLVLAGANYYNDQSCLSAIETLTPNYIESKFPTWAAQLEQQHGSQGSGYWKELARQLRELWLLYPNFTTGDLSRIKVPALVMTGQYDPFGSVAQTMDIQSAIGGSELCIVPGAAHAVMSQRPDITTMIILDYLDRRRRKRNR